MKEDAVGSGRRGGVGAAGWYLAAGGAKPGSSTSAGRPAPAGGAADELAAPAFRRGGWRADAGALGPVPLDGAALESDRMEDGAAVLALRGEKAAAWLSSEPLDRLGVYSVPWRGSARPGVLYTEYLGSGWYAGYACLGWG
ncbi:MAG: toxin-antitoxin system antitoxin subunit [Flavonifractor plautii]